MKAATPVLQLVVAVYLPCFSAGEKSKPGNTKGSWSGAVAAPPS